MSRTTSLQISYTVSAPTLSTLATTTSITTSINLLKTSGTLLVSNAPSANTVLRPQPSTSNASKPRRSILGDRGDEGKATKRWRFFSDTLLPQRHTQIKHTPSTLNLEGKHAIPAREEHKGF